MCASHFQEPAIQTLFQKADLAATKFLAAEKAAFQKPSGFRFEYPSLDRTWLLPDTPMQRLTILALHGPFGLKKFYKSRPTLEDNLRLLFQSVQFQQASIADERTDKPTILPQTELAAQVLPRSRVHPEDD